MTNYDKLDIINIDNMTDYVVMVRSQGDSYRYEIISQKAPDVILYKSPDIYVSRQDAKEDGIELVGLLATQGRRARQKICPHDNIRHHPRPCAEADSWDECLDCGIDMDYVK